MADVADVADEADPARRAGATTPEAATAPAVPAPAATAGSATRPSATDRPAPAPPATQRPATATATETSAIARLGRVRGQVRIVGSGLLGTSIGLALRARGVDVIVEDVSPVGQRLAVEYGAGRPPEPDSDRPDLIVVAVPPDVTAAVVAAELERHPHALVTDVASVKLAPLEELQQRAAPIERYLGSHPMAGRERGGAVSARADLFVGRPWIIAAHERTRPDDVARLEALVLDLGATPIDMRAADHDRAVALISHVPHVVAALLAARLTEGRDDALNLAGQGLRDTTRIASGDPALWLQILGANASAVADVLRPLHDDLAELIDALSNIEQPGASRTVVEHLENANRGAARIPGKHGHSARYATLTIKVDDRPGELARLLTEIGEEDVNMEDLRLEHSPEAEVGFAEIAVVPEAAGPLADALTTRGWTIMDRARG